MMMDSIKIDVGIKRVMVNDDPTRVIQFNPTDVSFAERFYELLQELEVKQGEYQKRAEAIESANEVDENGIPKNIAEQLALLRDACEYMRGKVDAVFGAGTSQAAFGDALSMDMFAQFFEGITPFVQTARDSKLAQYNRKTAGRVMK